jgi:hypothetical protein
MTVFRYNICAPIRLLLPISTVFLALPCIFKRELLNYYAFPIFYFFGSYFFFLNFPTIGETLHGKPIYVEDLVLTMDGIDDHSFKKAYSVIMNFILAILFAVFSEYIIIQGVRDKPMIEIFAIIGGNWSLYMKAQNIVGKIILDLCHCMKTQEVRRRLSDDNTVEMSKTSTSIK